MSQLDLQNQVINVLMYHSISERVGPTNIPEKTFESQIGVLQECGYQAVSLADFAKWHAGELELSERAVVITFDDGFADFAEHAVPKLLKYNWSATNFIPTGKIGGCEDWDDGPSRELLDWDQVIRLAGQGIDFGGHSVRHVDLTTLPPDDLHTEIRQSHDEIEKRLGTAPTSFAPPYGKLNETVRKEISKCYDISVGTRLDRADRQCNLFDVPRIEMHYFRDIDRWRAYLNGRAEWYFNTRKILRRVKASLPV